MMYRMVQVLKRGFAALFLVFFSLSLSSCDEKPPIKIGFVGGLTGRVADLGVAGRNGVILAIDEQNQAGGIANRKIQLIVKDDQQDSEKAQNAVQELINEDVEAIIGPMTSSMALVVKPLADSSQTVIISPTAKTDQLSGQDDFFLRVTTPLSTNAEQMASSAATGLNLKRFAVVYDQLNRAFTETWFKFFSQALLEHEGEIVFLETFDSQPEVHFLPIAERLLNTDPDAVLLLSSAIDTALLSQQIRKLGSQVPLFSSEWASTTDLLSFGGRAVEGMTSFHSFNSNSQERRYLAFKDRFVKRFGSTPSFASALSYDAATYLLAGLMKRSSGKDLKKTLLGFNSFTGLQSEIVVDKYGDVSRRLFQTVIEDGRFKVREAL